MNAVGARGVVVVTLLVGLTSLPLVPAVARTDLPLVDAISFAVGTSGEPGSLPEYWSATFQEAELGDYTDPTIRDLNTTGPGSVNGCGTPAEDVAGNAVYCNLDESIVYDMELMSHMQQAFGAASTIAVLAHEWGHHVQNLTAVPAFSQRAELQADCYAGMYVGHLVEVDILQPADVLDSLGSTESAGDDPNLVTYTNWHDSGVHGTSYDRRQAFGTGYSTGDPLLCREYERWDPEPVLEITPYMSADAGREAPPACRSI